LGERDVKVTYSLFFVQTERFISLFNGPGKFVQILSMMTYCTVEFKIPEKLRDTDLIQNIKKI